MGLVPALQGWEGEGSARRRGGLPLDQGSVTSHPAALSPSLLLTPGRVWSRIRPCLPIPASPSRASSETPMRHPIPCYEPAPWMGGDGESPAAWDGTQAAPATHPRERGLVTSMSPCPWRSTLSLRSKCHPGPAAASPSALQLPSPCHQHSRKKPSKNLPASAMQRLPFASAEVYWRSQHRALSVDGYMCAHL